MTPVSTTQFLLVRLVEYHSLPPALFPKSNANSDTLCSQLQVGAAVRRCSFDDGPHDLSEDLGLCRCFEIVEIVKFV